MKSSNHRQALLCRLLVSAAVALPIAVGAAETQTKEAGTFALTAGNTYPIGSVKLTLTTSGDLQVRSASGEILWRSGTNATCGNCHVTFQNDHNLVLYTPSGNVSLSRTANKYGTVLTLSDTVPYLSVGPRGGTPIWSTQNVFSPGNALLRPGVSTAAAGALLTPGQTVSTGGVFLSVATDGRVEVKKVTNAEPLWSSGSSAECTAISVCSLHFTFVAGNPEIQSKDRAALELRGPSGNVVWTTSTLANSGASLRLSGYKPYLSITTANRSVNPPLHPVVWATGFTGHSAHYGTEQLRLGSNKKVTIGGGATLALTPCGVIEIAKEGTTLWRSEPTPAASCTGSPSLVFGGDGNLVVYKSSVWQTGTPNNHSGRLVLSATEPHVTVLNGRSQPVWRSSGSLGGGPLEAPAPVSEPALARNQAKSVHSFLDSLGVNTHQDQGGNYSDPALVMEKLRFIGVSHIRDHAPVSPLRDANRSSREQAWFNALTQQRYSFTLLDYSTDPATIVQNAKLAGPNVVAIEGMNEINNFKYRFNGFFCEAGTPNNCGGAAIDAQNQLFQAVRADNALNNVAVFDLTAGSTAMHARDIGLYSSANRADYNNVHVYPAAEKLANAQPFAEMAKALGKDYDSVAPSGGVITEAGYKTDVVTEKAQAIMGLNVWLDGYRLGFRRTYLYELFDAPVQTSALHGMFNSNRQPKQLAWAAHRLTSRLLAGLGEPVANPGTLNWSTTPALTSAEGSILLQKSSKVFYLILWKEPAVTVPNGTKADDRNDIPVTNLQIHVPGANIKVYDLIDPSNEVQGNGSVALQLGANQRLAEITLP